MSTSSSAGPARRGEAPCSGRPADHEGHGPTRASCARSATTPTTPRSPRRPIAMAHSMGLTVVAESVETEKQLDFLRERACDEWQGLLFSRPLPARLRPRAQSLPARTRALVKDPRCPATVSLVRLRPARASPDREPSRRRPAPCSPRPERRNSLPALVRLLPAPRNPRQARRSVILHFRNVGPPEPEPNRPFSAARRSRRRRPKPPTRMPTLQGS